MKNGLNPTQILQAYETVMKQGRITPQGRILDGIEALNRHDGFPIHLRGEGVDLKVCSLKRFHLDYNQLSCRDAFLKKLAILAQ
ncbi:DUF3081 family protein [Vibrio sp. YMD68]|uniref:DUF3081 family protein n=1 Tax=Vibrio sp. YMD68 TaxID=3042300 RepID=UPI00249BA39D|nr:DUF3081 family protein [Vibrio sp. YMD68]WGV98583.1 DUF3081 family protein [Vibrio sp. YMD68]